MNVFSETLALCTVGLLLASCDSSDDASEAPSAASQPDAKPVSEKAPKDATKTAAPAATVPPADAKPPADAQPQTDTRPPADPATRTEDASAKPGAGAATGLTGTVVDLESRTLTFGAHAQRLTGALSTPWPAADFPAGPSLPWGAKGTYMESLAVLCGQTGHAPGYFADKLSFQETTTMAVAATGPVLVVVSPDRFESTSMKLTVLLEPTLSAKRLELGGLRAGSAEVSAEADFFELETPNGIIGRSWKVADAAKLSGALEVDVDLDVLAQTATIAVDTTAGATGSDGPITLTVESHEAVEDSGEQVSQLRIAFEGAALLSTAPDDPTAAMRMQMGSADGRESGSFTVRYNKQLGAGTKLVGVFAKASETHRVTERLTSIDYGAWFVDK